MAVIQINDPDPVFWLIVYLAVAVVPASRVLGMRLPVVFGVVAGLVVAALLISFPGFIDYLESGDYAALTGGMTADKPYIESAREFLGMAIGALCLAFYWRWHGGTKEVRAP